MSRATTIVPYRDGPYLVRGPVTILDQDGQLIECHRPTVALCRCGKSRTRPFCDGTHQVIRFTAPSPREDRLESRARPRPSLPDAPADTGQSPLRRARRLLLQAERELEAVENQPASDGPRRQLLEDLRRLADRLDSGL